MTKLYQIVLINGLVEAESYEQAIELASYQIRNYELKEHEDLRSKAPNTEN